MVRLSRLLVQGVFISSEMKMEVEECSFKQKNIEKVTSQAVCVETYTKNVVLAHIQYLINIETKKSHSHH